MTMQPANAAHGTGRTPAAASAVDEVRDSAALGDRVEAAEPVEEAARAIEASRQRLAAAAAAVASGDAEQTARAYDLAGECTDHIARALWYLRRAQRERERAGGGGGGAQRTPG